MISLLNSPVGDQISCKTPGDVFLKGYFHPIFSYKPGHCKENPPEKFSKDPVPVKRHEKERTHLAIFTSCKKT